jgi:hypothetical protein
MILLTEAVSLVKALSVSLCLCVEPVLAIEEVDFQHRGTENTEAQRITRRKTEKAEPRILSPRPSSSCVMLSCLENVSEPHDDAPVSTVSTPLVEEVG